MIIVSGLCWASYSLIGRGSRTPLVDTAGNFLRSAPIAVGIGAWGAVNYPIDMRGVVLAIASGAIASGVGYAIWYAVLPALTRTRAAIVQLTVPAIAALAESSCPVKFSPRACCWRARPFSAAWP